jgi:putative transposase
MHDLAVLILHLLATVARLAGPGGARAGVAESVLVKQQLLILNRSRRLTRAAIVLKPSTLLRLHRALITGKYRRLFSASVQRSRGRRAPTGRSSPPSST